MQPNFEQPKFLKNLFPDYMGIPILSPTNSRKFNGKLFTTKIHGESHPISMCILVMYPKFFHVNFHVNVLLAKLPDTSTRGFLSM